MFRVQVQVRISNPLPLVDIPEGFGEWGYIGFSAYRVYVTENNGESSGREHGE